MTNETQQNLNEFYKLAFFEHEKIFALKAAIELGLFVIGGSSKNETFFFKTRDELFKAIEKPTFILEFIPGLPGELHQVSIEIFDYHESYETCA